jgi:hypothetical protein
MSMGIHITHTEETIMEYKLYGITPSGKTECYIETYKTFHEAREALKQLKTLPGYKQPGFWDGYIIEQRKVG